MRPFLSPQWLLRHLFLLCALAGMTVLGVWQWHRADASSGGLRNAVYAFEWWVFCGFAVYVWWRAIQEERHPERVRAAGVRPDPHAGKTIAEQEADDPELKAYNDYLAWLNANPKS